MKLEMYWINTTCAEQLERDQIDQELACKQHEAQLALDSGCWSRFLMIAGDIALLLDEYDAPEVYR